MTETDTMVNVTPIEVAQRQQRSPVTTSRETVFDIQNLSVSYGKTRAIKDISFEIYRNMVTAPSSGRRAAERARSSAR